MKSLQKPRRVLVVGINYAPERIGTGKYTSEFCEWLAARGHAVRMVTAPPYYPEWEVTSHALVPSRASERRGCDLGAEAAARSNAHVASGFFVATSFFALVASVAGRPDVVINVAPTLVSAPIATSVQTIRPVRKIQLSNAPGNRLGIQ